MMKDRNAPSKYDRYDSRRNNNRSRDSDHNSESFKHVLKERHHYRDDDRNKKRDEDRSKKRDKDYDNDLKQSASHSHKRRRSDSPTPKSSKSKSDSDRNHKNQASVTNESYEELSRRKKKLESELRALDLEEAAEKEAENKKTSRDRPNKSTNKAPEVKVKREPTSDDEKDRKKSSSDKKGSKSSSRNERYEKTAPKEEKQDKKHSKDKVHVKTEPEKHGQASGSSSDEPGGWGISEPKPKPADKEKPNFATSGKLAEETNTYNGVVIKYNEPAEARKPKRRWRLYPFKGDSDLPFIPIHRQSAYLFGRTRLIADIPIDHPSCSKQHAVLQYRLVPYKREDGTTGRRVRPYIIDLESSNGTYVNNNRVDPRCYVELIEKDVVKFGYSSREYVILHEESKFTDDDDDVMDGNS